MKRKLILFLASALVSISGIAQDLNQFQRFQFIQNGDTLPYRLLLPKDYDTKKSYPLVIFLHGRGESGRDNQKQLVHGAKMFLADSVRDNYPAIVVFPQCGEKSYWSNVQTIADSAGKRTFFFVPDGPPSEAMQLLVSFTDFLLLQYKVKKDQVYAMGLSMGGMGTFELVRRKPGVFAAAIPICGGAHPATAASMAKTKWWIFHGAKDDVVLPQYSKVMQLALKSAGSNPKFTLYPDANHNSWDPAFHEPGILKWLFSQKKK